MTVTGAARPPESFDNTAAFLIELARRLHMAGITASRLEGAIRSTARALGVNCEIWSAPTGLLLSLTDSCEQRSLPLTRVLRLEPGDVDLAALVTLDNIAERVVAGELSIADARQRMSLLDRAPTRSDKLRAVGAFGLAAASVTALLRTGWVDVAVAAVLGLIIGWLAVSMRKYEHAAPALEAIAAFVATFLATMFSAYSNMALSLQTVVIASLIVLMPGLTLTTAVAELAGQQLVTGTTRLAGAVMTLMKLTFGSLAASQLLSALGVHAPLAPAPSLPVAVEFVAMFAAAFAIATLFRAPKRDIPLVMGSAVLGYLLTRAGGAWLALGNPAAFSSAVFFSSIVIAALANVYGRIAGRPGALVRVAGIMLLVPGSGGFRGLTSVMENNFTLGVETAVAVVGALIALVAGILFGSLIVPPRRYL
jgi:uncharacterized membrane protein YjjP (DUF1212 family)